MTTKKTKKKRMLIMIFCAAAILLFFGMWALTVYIYDLNFNQRFESYEPRMLRPEDFEDLEHFPSRVLQMGEPKIVNGAPYFTEEQKQILNDSRKWNVELGKGIVDFRAIVDAAESR